LPWLAPRLALPLYNKQRLQQITIDG
jgi:hypothetical protein